jgi:hypothetical protein
MAAGVIALATLTNVKACSAMSDRNVPHVAHGADRAVAVL